MWKFIKQCWEDWISIEQDLAKQGIIRFYTIYGVIDYYEHSHTEEKQDEHKKDTVV